MNSLFLPIPEFENYSINSSGDVINNYLGRPMRISYVQRGVATVGLSNGGYQHKRSVAKLVAELFLDPPHRDDFDTPIHLNGDRRDCRAENLAWRPRWFAIMYHKECRKPKYADHFQDNIWLEETGEHFENIGHAARTFGLLEWDVLRSIMNSRDERHRANDLDAVFMYPHVYHFRAHFGN